MSRTATVLSIAPTTGLEARSTASPAGARRSAQAVSCPAFLRRFVIGLVGIACGFGLLPYLEGTCHAQYDPSGLIRFDTPAEADARRQTLIDTIWPNGLPTGPTNVPTVTSDVAFPTADLVHNAVGFEGVDSAKVAQVDRMDFVTNVQGYQLPTYGYMLTPNTPLATPRFAIVHPGHGGNQSGGIGGTVNFLLDAGFHVSVLAMPLIGVGPFSENPIMNNNLTQRTMTLPGGGTDVFAVQTTCCAPHDRLFDQYEGTSGIGANLGAEVLRYYLEQTIQTINYFTDQNPDVRDITMIGKSGGGWATHMAAAIDTRIDLSIPTAGAMPLYLVGTSADPEQNYAPVFGESQSPGAGGTTLVDATGAASWLEIFALGGYGAGRKQIQLLNEFDSCCFRGASFDDESYETFVSDEVDNLGVGNWDLVTDTTHNEHLISPWALDNVIRPALIKVGDFDGDGHVGILDYGILKDHWRSSVSAYADGDVTGDGFVGLIDFKRFKNEHYEGAASLASLGVPEPTALVLLLLASSPAWLVRREHSRAR